MSEKDKDELARLLGAMAAGQHAHEGDEEQTDEAAPAAFESREPPASPAPAAPRASNRPATPMSAPLAAPPPQRVAMVRRRRRLVQTLGFKRTIIPVLLTLGALCPTLGLLGFFVSPISPFAKLAEGWFSISFVLIGLVMLGLGVLTMLQVRNELSKRQL